MIIPNSFKKGIAGQFYDKTITVYQTSELVEADGRAHTVVEGSSEFLGNVSYSRLGKLMEQYGIAEKIDVAITAPKDTSVVGGQVIGYGSKYFKVLEVRETDSHKLILGKQWVLKQELSA